MFLHKVWKELNSEVFNEVFGVEAKLKNNEQKSSGQIKIVFWLLATCQGK